MLNRISDFYRVVNASPSDVVITQRRDAITAYMHQLKGTDLMIATVDIAAFGVEPTPSASQLVAGQALVAAIQTQQPSFPNDLAANPLDLRVCAAVALGEYLDLAGDENASQLLAAALIVCALATRPPSQERHLASLLKELLDVACRALDRTGGDVRKRTRLQFHQIQGSEPAALAKSLNTEFENFKDALERNLRADREELDILWWVFGSHSTTLGKPFPEIDIGARGVAAAAELAELTLLPPTLGSARFLVPILREDRHLTIRDLIQSCPQDLLQRVARHRDTVGAVLRNHPSLLPITWLCTRRLDSGVSTGWEAEFEHKAHIGLDDKRPVSRWAVQVFNEYVAARLLGEPKE